MPYSFKPKLMIHADLLDLKENFGAKVVNELLHFLNFGVNNESQCLNFMLYFRQFFFQT
jgi:hypothetical protein